MKTRTLFAVAAALVASSTAAFAGSSDTQTVTFEVQAINEIAITGSPTLIISAATAGVAPTSVSDSSTSYAITTNESNQKITAKIDSGMPAGLTLNLSAAAPAGASAADPVALSTTDADLVTGISTLNDASKALTYELQATSAAGVVASQTRTVTLTITAGA